MTYESSCCLISHLRYEVVDQKEGVQTWRVDDSILNKQSLTACNGLFSILQVANSLH
jgi:hypothetical protein